MAILIPFPGNTRRRESRYASHMISGRVQWYHAMGSHHSDSTERRELKQQIQAFVAEHAGPCALESRKPVSKWNTGDLWSFIMQMAALTPEHVPIPFYGGERRLTVISLDQYHGKSARYVLHIRCGHGFDVNMDLPEAPPDAAVLGVLARRGASFTSFKVEQEPKRGAVKTSVRM